jgi:hypothetical protein
MAISTPILVSVLLVRFIWDDLRVHLWQIAVWSTSQCRFSIQHRAKKVSIITCILPYLDGFGKNLNRGQVPWRLNRMLDHKAAKSCRSLDGRMRGWRAVRPPQNDMP